LISHFRGLPSGLTPKSFGTKSVVRNPVIASLLHQAGYIEKIGTGIRRIEKAVKEHGKGNVNFSFDSFFTVSFSRVRTSQKILADTTQETSGKKLGERLGEKLGEKLGENRLKIISLMKENSKISITEIADKAGISTTSIEKNIGYLKKQGIVSRIGPAKGAYWEVVRG